MRVSQFEIYRLVQRALEGMGAGYGLDRDGAGAVVWLEARELPGLARLADDLDGLERSFDPPRLRLRHADRLVIDAEGRSALGFAGAAIDLLIGLAVGNGSGVASLRLERCGSPLFLLPIALAATGGRRGFVQAWQSSLGAVRIQIAGGGAVAVYLPPGIEASAALRGGAPVDIEIAVVAPAVASPASANGLPPAIDEGELARRLARSLDRGVEVDPAVWRRIHRVAARVQVPASAESRTKGAGGGDANY